MADRTETFIDLHNDFSKREEEFAKSGLWWAVNKSPYGELPSTVL